MTYVCRELDNAILEGDWELARQLALAIAEQCEEILSEEGKNHEN